MRIAILANALAVHTRRWAMAYAARGHEVHVFSIRQADIPGVAVHRIGVGSPSSHARWLTALSYLWLLLFARSRVRAMRPDVVHAHYTVTHGVIAALAGLEPLVVTAWGSDVIWRGPGRPPTWFRLLNRVALRGADGATGASAFLCRAVHPYVRNAARVHEIPFGVDTELFRPAERSTAHPDGLRIAFVKGLNRKYGAGDLIRAMPAVLEALPGARLALAGRGPLAGSLRALATQLGVADSIDFLGFVPHDAVPDLLRASDVLVNPSVVPESFGVAVLEAGACGLPVVATRVGGVPEVCRDGETGLLVPPGEPKALAQAIVQLGGDPPLRARLGGAGRELVVRAFEWDRCVDKMLELVHEMSRLNGRHGPASLMPAQMTEQPSKGHRRRMIRRLGVHLPRWKA